ncbi:MAG: lytic transglycosylase domain-containing protein [Thermodesulfobacteriota bacterium]
MKSRMLKLISYGLMLICLIGIPPSSALSKTIALPLTLDYNILRSMVIQRSFTGPGQSAMILDSADGCNSIRISDPKFSEKKSRLWCETRVQIRAGVPYGDACVMPSELNGFLAFHIEPVIDPKTLTLTFRTLDSAVYDQHHRPRKAADIIWEMIKKDAYDYINRMTIRLEPAISELKTFLELLFPDGLPENAKTMIDHLRLGAMKVTSDAVRIDILTEVEEIDESGKKEESEDFSDRQLTELIEAWETWDTFLVEMIMSMTRRHLSEGERGILFETLLDARHRFTDELMDPTLGKDLVREQFIEAWTQLSPIFRNHLGKEVSEYTLGYLSFFTASDALVALDQIGPSLGIEISRNGLIRLAGLISRDRPVALDYDLSLNPDLREILDLGKPLPEDIHFDESEEPESQYKQSVTGNYISTHSLLLAGLFSDFPAFKTQVKEISGESRVKNWIPPEENIDPYIHRVDLLLKTASSIFLKKAALKPVYHDFFRRLIPSIAWQESCYRQFRREGKEITFVISYNLTSVGIMQINERVWRGIYDPHQLKWSIHYNVMAGCEIAEQYLRRYALEKLKKKNPKSPLTEELVAAVVYAMYNGGPGQLEKYLIRKKKNHPYLSDKLFLEKFRWINHGKLDNIKICLQGY